MKNDEKHVNTLNNQWKIIKHILKIMKNHWKNNEQHLQNNETSMKTIFKIKTLNNNEKHLRNTEKSLNAVPDFLKGVSGLNKQG